MRSRGNKKRLASAGEVELHAYRGRFKALRAAGIGAASLGLVAGVLAAGVGLAGASTQHRSAPSNHEKSASYSYAKYVGGHGKANTKLSPITIGIVNQQTATDAPAPEWTVGAEIAEKYLNENTGGIDGHPVKLDLCKIATTVADASTCGQEFADNGAIDAVAAGPIDVGNTALESALEPAKKPLFFGISLSTVDEKDPHGFILYGDVTHIEAPMATFAKKRLHAKSVSITYPENIPAEVQSADIIEDALKYEGVKTVYKVGFTSADTNLTEPFEAAHVGSTTLLMAVNSGGPSCSDTYLTLKSLGVTTKVLANIPCDTPTIAKADGGELPHDWYYADARGTLSTKAIAAFVKIATTYGDGPIGHVSFTESGFGQVVTIAKFDTAILKAGKRITPAAVTAAARAFKGPMPQGTPHLRCGSFKGFPAVCNGLINVFQNTAPTVMKPVVKWIGAPKGFKVTLTA